MKINFIYFYALVLLLGCLAVTPARSQDRDARRSILMPYNERLQKGHYMVGADFSGAFSMYVKSWQVTGRGGYLLADKWVGGVQLTSKFEDINRGYIISGSRIDSKLFTVVPELYTRYYFFTSRFCPVAQVSAGYRIHSQKHRAVDLNQMYSTKDGSFQLGAALGVSYQVTHSINLELMYSVVTYTAPKSVFSNSGSATDGNLKLGVAYFFNRK